MEAEERRRNVKFSGTVDEDVPTQVMYFYGIVLEGKAGAKL